MLEHTIPPEHPELNQKLWALFDLLENGISIQDQHGTILKTNSAIPKILDLDNKLIGKKCYQSYHKQTDICIHCPLKEATEKTRYMVFSKDGRTLESRADIVFSEGKSLFLVEQFREVQPLISGSSQQEGNVKKLAQLVSILAHEVRRPLGAIQVSVDYLAHILRSSQKGQKHLKIISEEIFRINQIIRDLLDLTQPNRESWQRALINSQVQLALSSLKEPFASRQFVVETHFDTELPPVWINPVRIQQVFVNLIENAYQAMPQGGLLNITTRKSEDVIFIEFSDTGEGIAAENMPRLFEPFVTTRPNGTGLGLFLSQIIVDIHRGTIEILSKPGKGTTVVVKLPLSQTNEGGTYHVFSQ